MKQFFNKWQKKRASQSTVSLLCKIELCLMRQVFYTEYYTIFINALISVNNTGCSKSPDTISICFYEINAQNILTGWFYFNQRCLKVLFQIKFCVPDIIFKCFTDVSNKPLLNGYSSKKGTMRILSF